MCVGGDSSLLIEQVHYFTVQSDADDTRDEECAFPLTVIAHLGKETSLVHEGGREKMQLPQTTTTTTKTRGAAAKRRQEKKQSATGIAVSVQAIRRRGVSV